MSLEDMLDDPQPDQPTKREEALVLRVCAWALLGASQVVLGFGALGAYGVMVIAALLMLWGAYEFERPLEKSSEEGCTTSS